MAAVIGQRAIRRTRNIDRYFARALSSPHLQRPELWWTELCQLQDKVSSILCKPRSQKMRRYNKALIDKTIGVKIRKMLTFEAV